MIVFCPFLSIGRSEKAECEWDCALYDGSVDGASPQCVLFSIGLAVENISNVEDTVLNALKNIKRDPPGS